MSQYKNIRKRALSLAVVAAVSSVVLAGCGDSDSDAAVDTSDLTGDPIKFGLAASQTGPQAANGIASTAAVEAWQDQVNSEGGINGSPVEFTIVDTKNTVPGAQAAVKNLLGDEDLDALFVTDLVAEGAIAEQLSAAPVPVISAGGSAEAPAWNGYPNLFTTTAGNLHVVGALIPAAKAAGATNLGFAVCKEVAACADGAAALSPGVEAAGMTYSGTQDINASATNYTAECLAFQDKGVDNISMIVGVDTAVRVFADCLQQGYEGTFGTPASGFNSDKIGKIDGVKIVGDIQGFPWWADAEPVERYRDAMSKYSPDVSLSDATATSTWGALELVKKSIGSSTDVTGESLRDALYQVEDETLDGLLAEPVTYTEGEPSPVIKCLWTFTFTGGDENPELIEPVESGNGETGDLASTCLPE